MLVHHKFNIFQKKSWGKYLRKKSKIRRKKMKRFWLILLSLGLIIAFSTSAFALDVKFSGSFYVAGIYLDKTNLVKPGPGASDVNNPSTAFYFQRLRLQTDFVVSPGLTLITRFDALERAWGAPRSSTGTTLAVDSAGTTAENENIAFDWTYIDYVSPIGTFDVGYMNYGSTGTIFGNNSTPQGRIKYSYTIGPATINAALSKIKEQSLTAKNPGVTTTDADQDVYHLEGVYKWKDGLAGLNVNYYRYADTRPAPNNYKLNYFLFTPYAIAKIGPVALQAELNYATGKTKQYDDASLGTDITLENWSGWIDATATFGPIYFGGTFAYVSGDDLTTTNKSEGGTINGGRDWNPCLILFNYYDRTYWVGALPGNGTSTNSGPMTNAWFYQGRVGFTPTAALDIMASVSYSYADQKPTTAWLNKTYGWEVDVIGTYKITNNLSYMLGFGYFLTGDYFKGAVLNSEVRDDYMVINKLTLTF
jgi:hypothetical protein